MVIKAINNLNTSCTVIVLEALGTLEVLGDRYFYSLALILDKFVINES